MNNADEKIEQILEILKKEKQEEFIDDINQRIFAIVEINKADIEEVQMQLSEDVHNLKQAIEENEKAIANLNGKMTVLLIMLAPLVLAIVGAVVKYIFGF